MPGRAIVEGMASTFEERAEARRRGWSGGRVDRRQSLAADVEFWQAATPEERVAAVWAMVEEAWTLEGHDGTPPRLSRSAFGVRRR